MHQRAFLGSGWARGGTSEMVRRAHPASGAQWNVQVVRGKVNGKCLWNACKALSLGLLLMVLGAAMATIGYYADHLSVAKEVRGNFTVHVKNESKGFHLNNLSYAGPIVMGVGGFIVVAACVMTFEARDSAAKVVPARFKMNATCQATAQPACGRLIHPVHNSLRTSGSQTGQYARHLNTNNRRALTHSFLQFSRGLALDTHQKHMLKVPQNSINKSPSAPDLAIEAFAINEKFSPILSRTDVKTNKKTCAFLNPKLLHRHALSVDETAAANYSHESLQPSGSQGSMAMDLHLECPVTLRVRDKRRNPLRRQRKVEEDEKASDEASRRSSHSCSPGIPSHYTRELSTTSGGSGHHLEGCHSRTCSTKRRSSNSSDITHRSRSRRKDCHHHRGQLERAISSDSRLTGAIPKCRHHRHYNTPTQISTEEPVGASSDSDIHKVHVVPE